VIVAMFVLTWAVALLAGRRLERAPVTKINDRCRS
jgi:hypothetical protein